MSKPADLSVTGLRHRHVLTRASSCQAACSAWVCTTSITCSV